MLRYLPFISYRPPVVTSIAQDRTTSFYQSYLISEIPKLIYLEPYLLAKLVFSFGNQNDNNLFWAQYWISAYGRSLSLSTLNKNCWCNLILRCLPSKWQNPSLTGLMAYQVCDGEFFTLYLLFFSYVNRMYYLCVLVPDHQTQLLPIVGSSNYKFYCDQFFCFHPKFYLIRCGCACNWPLPWLTKIFLSESKCKKILKKFIL